MMKPDYQWQGAQGYEWWELDIVQDKFSSTEQELIVKINDRFVVRAFTTKKVYGFYDSEIHINDAYYMTSCEHVDEDLYWLFDNLEQIVFIQDTKKNKVKAIKAKRFEKKKSKILSKFNIKTFTLNGEINIGERKCPICGKFEFPEETDSYTICRFCGWEDEAVNDPNEFSDANYMSQNGYKKKYAEFISADPNYIWERSFTKGKFIDPRKNNKNTNLKEDYKEIFEIVKQHIDNWDCIGLFDLGRPKDEYDIEIAAIVPTAYRTDNVEELTERIVDTFMDYFGDAYNSPKKEAKAVAERILQHKAEKKPDKLTY